jgi:hypothetical protein
MRTKLVRMVSATAATAALALAMTASPAQAHTVRAGNDYGFIELTSNHATLNVCRVLGHYPDSDIWGTVKYVHLGVVSLVRYDAPTNAGLCYPHNLAVNDVSQVRYCWRLSGGNNNCTAWKNA